MCEGGGGGGGGGGDETELKLWGIGSTWRQLPTMKKNITIRKSDLGILKSIFEGILANIKIKLRYMRFLHPANVTVDISTVESQIAIAFIV